MGLGEYRAFEICDRRNKFRIDAQQRARHLLQFSLDFAQPLDVLFSEYHERNPHVYELFKRFAMQARNAGRRRFGAKAIMERVRWYAEIETHGGDGFKVNNNFTSRYARMLIDEYPEFKGFFETRRLQT